MKMIFKDFKILVGYVLFMLIIHLSDSSKVVGCYYGNWAGYRNGEGRFEPKDIDATLCTHLFYSFVGITSDGGIRHLDEWSDLGKDYFGQFNALKKQNPQIKTLIAIGGWNEGSLLYSQVANNAQLRAAFARNAADFVQQHGFDGFDVDWEYPAARGGAPSDYDAYVLLLKELRSVFDERGGLLLTAAVGINPSYVSTSYNVREISKYLDLINLMTYDYHGSWETTTGHNSPLYKSKVDISPTESALNVNASVHQWLAHGAIAGKLVLGVGSYGQSFTLIDPSNHAIGAPTSGPGTAGPHTAQAGTLGFNEICDKINSGWIVEWDDAIVAPYAHIGNQWVGFDNVKSATIKAQYAKDMALAGVFIWSLETEDFLDKCGEGKFPLLKAFKEVLLSDGNNNGINSSSSTSPGVSISSSSSQTSASTSSPSSSTASGNQLCSLEGHVADPNDCRVFYFCQSDGRGGFIIHKFNCSGDLVFDPQTNSCNYRDQVPGCT